MGVLKNSCSADSKPSPYLVPLLPNIFPLLKLVPVTLCPQKNNIMEKFICPLKVHVFYICRIKSVF